MPGGTGVTATNRATVPAGAVFLGITRRVVTGARGTLIRYVYAPDSAYPHHSRPREHTTAVLRGRIAFDIAGEERTLRPGEVAFITGGVPHGAAPVDDEEVETPNALRPRRTTELRSEAAVPGSTTPGIPR